MRTRSPFAPLLAALLLGACLGAPVDDEATGSVAAELESIAVEPEPAPPPPGGCTSCDFNVSDFGCRTVGQACANKTGTCAYSQNAQPNAAGECRCYCKDENGNPIVPKPAATY